MTMRPTRFAAATVLLVLSSAIASLSTPAAGSATGRRLPAANGTTCTGDPLPARQMTAKLLKGGFAFTEGPTWVAHGGYLLFSNLQNAAGPEAVQPSSIWRFTPPGTWDRYIDKSGSNGLAVTPDGTRIIAATHDRRSVSSFRIADRSRGVVAGDYDGRAFNSPNDVTIAADGTVYFTDPNYQRGNRPDGMGGMTGVFRVRGGRVELVDGTLSQPNGIALAPEGTRLYVAATGTNQIFAYPIAPDGTVGPRVLFATLASPDGVTIDCAGNLYWASYVEGVVHVFAPDGTQLGTIAAGRNTTNAAFGGPDGRTLFLTSGTPGTRSTPADFGIYSVALNLPGNPY